jgi:arylsulfatase A-like enzyme
MKLWLYSLLIILLFSCNNNQENKGAFDSSSSKPNIILFVADDLGYGDIGVYGQDKIDTPNIDSLAKQGVLFTHHYAGSAVCAPSRCILLTGMHAGHASIRYNDAWPERSYNFGAEVEYCNKYLEGQYPMKSSDITIAEALKPLGYTTAIVGKWGLGAPISVSTPNKQGFDYFYGYNCQRQAHNLYPEYLWENGKMVKLNNTFYYPDSKFPEGTDVNDPREYQNYKQKDYAPELMHTKALEFIENNSDAPFFLYYASPLPHPPLQIPPKYIEKYHKIFGDEKPYLGEETNDIPCRYPRATYAAMVNLLDNQLGELVALLKKKNILENTIIIITSDNGPAYNGVAEFFNSAGIFSEKQGQIKSSLYEGGLRVPLIIYWNKKLPEKTTTSHLSSSYDLFPTLLEMVGAKNNYPIDGLSFYNSMLGKSNKNHDFIYWEYAHWDGLLAAVLKQNYKLIIKNFGKKDEVYELYNLKDDPLEQNNLSNRLPNIVSELLSIAKKEHQNQSR